MSSNWSKGSVLAVDAGSHLAAIQKILHSHFPLVASHPQPTPLPIHSRSARPSSEPDAPSNELSSESSGDSGTPEPAPEPPETILEDGPFAGLSFPYASARANAVHIVREHVSTYLITHPHLDHLSGFAINTAAFHNTSRPKRLAALPFCVNAIKQHIFNDVIWPNLTDEDNGVGFVTFQRLTEGGNLALGEGNSRGFIEVCDGLAAKGFKVSHGRCAATPRYDFGRRGSGAQIVDPGGASQHSHSASLSLSHSHSHPQQHNGAPTPSAPAKTPDPSGRRASIFSQPSQPGTPTFYGGGQPEYQHCVVDSTAYFVRCSTTGREILIFGDVEPDSVSSFPRNQAVWAEAAPKIAQGILSGIFIECSYDDSVREEGLFGHLTPRHVIKELETLAEMVAEKRKEEAARIGRKRKRWSQQQGLEPSFGSGSRKHRHTVNMGSAEEVMRDASGPMDDVFDGPILAAPHERSAVLTPSIRKAATLDPHGSGFVVEPHDFMSAPPQFGRGHPNHHDPSNAIGDGRDTPLSSASAVEGPLKGVRVIIIHVKDTLTDGPLVGDTILAELKGHEAKLARDGKALGCAFEICSVGGSWWF